MSSCPTFVRYRDLRVENLNVDFQVHTAWTDGEGSIEQVLEAASAAGLAAIAFTEHVRRETDWFTEFVSDVRCAAGRYPHLRVYAGCETKAMDRQGTLDLTPEILESSEIVLGSVHRFPDGKGGFLDFRELGTEQMAEMEFQLAMGLVRNAPIDVLAHPGGMYERRHGVFPRGYFRELMRATLERPVAIEINSSYLRDVEGYLRLCEEINPYVSIGSDAHKLSELGHCRDTIGKHWKGAA